MNVDVVNSQNEKVGTLELSDELFGGRPRSHLVWESVVAANASERRGTHATKTRGLVSGSGRKPWRQKGTGRARVGEIRNPLWRKGGTVFGPQPRSYAYQIPKKVERGALLAALSIKIGEGALTVVDQLSCEERKTKAAAELLQRLGASGRVLLVDVKPDEVLERASRNLEGVRIVASGRLMARDVIGVRRVIATKAAVERLQEVLAS
jgi:large subunit ribosomal protein L4